MNDAQNQDSPQGMEFNDSKKQPRRQLNEPASRQAYMESEGDQGNQGDQDEISLAELWLKAKSVIGYLWRFKFLIMAVGLLFALGGYFKVKMAKPSYSASLNFALEQGGGSGGLSGLASQFGFSMGGGSEGLRGDNLLSLMKSRRIVQDVLLSKIYVEGDSILMLEQFLKANEMLPIWITIGLYPVDPLKCCDPKQDSAIGVVVEAVSGEALNIGAEVTASNVTVSYTGSDPVFAGAFVELLTAKSTNFYMQTKMANFKANTNMLKRRLDSVEAELRYAMVGYSAAEDQNSFTVQSVAKVPTLQKQMKVTMLQAYYAELVKNLELSKTIMAREEPLITIIDRPHYPLRVRESKLKSAAIGGVLGVFLTLLFLGGRAFLSDLNRQAAALKPKA